MNRLRLALLLACAGTLLSATAARAQSATPSPAVADQQCPAVSGGIAASAGGTPLSAGAALVVHDGSSPALVLTVPETVSAVAPQLGDTASFAPAAGGGTQIAWTLHDPSAPYRFLTLTAPGGVRAVAAMNLRGLRVCVQSAGPVDVMDLRLPNGLGTARFTVPLQSATMTVEASAAGDLLALKGTLNKADLTGTLAVSARVNGTVTDLGTASFGPAGLDGHFTQPLSIDVPPAGKLTIADTVLHVARTGSHVTASFVPALPAALPFKLDSVQAELIADAAGAPALRCAGAVQVKPTAPLLGAPPALSIALNDPVTIACDGGRYTDVSGKLAITWPGGALTNGTTTSFSFVVPANGPPRFTAVGALPDIAFDALGLQATVAGPALSSDDSGLLVKGKVSLGLRSFTTLATVPADLALAIRPAAAGAQPNLTLRCNPAQVPAAKPGTQPIALNLECSGGEIVGVSSSGGTIALPEGAGGGALSLPRFTVIGGKFAIAGTGACTPAGGAGSQKAFMSFGALALHGCTLDFDAPTASLKVTLDGSITPPAYLAAKGAALNVVATVGYRPKVQRYGLTHVDASLTAAKGQPVNVFGMELSLFQDAAGANRCGDPHSIVHATADESDLSDPLELELCAQATLPEYLSFESRPRIGLLKDGVLPPAMTRPPVMFFNGLRFGAAGISAPKPRDLSSDADCSKPTLANKPNAMVYYDCRAWGAFAVDGPEGSSETAKPVTLGPLSIRNVRLNLVAKTMNATNTLQVVPADAPQFHMTAEVAFAKYLSSDGPSGALTADFDHRHMVMLGEFSRPVTVRAGVVSIGLQGFQMDLSGSERKFVASGASVSSEGPTVNSLALYFKQITFLETNDGSGWKLKKLSAPVDVPKTALGLAYRLFSDLGASSFLNLFKLR